MKYFTYTSCALLLWFNLTACSQTPPEQDNAAVASANKQATKNSGYYNNTALFLAGMKTDSVAPFIALCQKPIWDSYSHSFDSIWDKVKEKNLIKAKNWGDTELADINKQTKTLFYPFSGPDFMYANTFFPKADKYILFGLEKTGSVPDMKKLSGASMSSLFVSINNSLEDILKSSFFKTIEMCKELNNAQIDGTLPVIMLFMARTGNSIKDIKNATINADGSVTVADTFITYKGANRFGHGVEITFSPNGQDTVSKKLYYFPADFTDEALAKNPACKAYLQKLDTNVTTMLKSASYLLHNTLFTFVRNTILAKSAYVMQDDSGIAFRFFDKAKWDIQLYGMYDVPIEVFKYCFQKDMNAAYAKGAKPFPVKYGYGKGRNLLIAKRKG